MEKLFCKKIELDYFDNLNKIEKVNEGDNICFMTGLFKTNKKHEILKDKLDEFLDLVKKITESDFFEAYLCSPFQAQLVNIGTYKVAVDDEGKLISLSDNKRDFICEEENILFRDIVLFYFKSKKSKEEINKIFGKEICFREGELPNNYF